MTTAEQSRATLRELIEARLGESPAGAFWGEQLQTPTAAGYQALMPDIGRKLGTRHLIASFAERDAATLEAPFGPMKIGAWKTVDAARTLLLAEIAAAEEAPFKALFAAYDGGDTDTRAAAIRAINFVDDGDVEAGMALVNDAGRTYLDVLLSAAWVQNPWSTAHMDDAQFRKAVLKALFCEVAVEGFIGLESRADAELATSLCEYADEREAAGRAVPDAVWIVSAIHPRPGLVARLIGRLEHPLPEARLVAIKALGNAADARSLSFLTQRLERETDDGVKAALEAVISRLGEGLK